MAGFLSVVRVVVGACLMAGCRPAALAERHGGWEAPHGRASPPPSQCRSILTLPAVRSEARADWRALLRYAWNALFWAGFVCWWVTGLWCVALSCWEAQQRKASRNWFQVEFIHGCQSPSPCSLPGDRYAAPPVTSIVDYTGGPGAVMCLFGAALAVAAALQAGMVSAGGSLGGGLCEKCSCHSGTAEAIGAA